VIRVVMFPSKELVKNTTGSKILGLSRQVVEGGLGGANVTPLVVQTFSVLYFTPNTPYFRVRIYSVLKRSSFDSLPFTVIWSHQQNSCKTTI
jgi:hypothetical protein